MSVEAIRVETDDEIQVTMLGEENVGVEVADGEVEIDLEVVGLPGPRGPQGPVGPAGPAGDGSDLPNLVLIFENHLI
jgi:hypothetical protein